VIKSENGEADRSDDSSEHARESGQGDQVGWRHSTQERPIAYVPNS
jgi:hypothetical protein